MPTKFLMTNDINGQNGFGLAFTDTAYSATLAAGVATTLTVPSSASMGGVPNTNKAQWLAIFSFTPGSEIWVANNGTAAAPAGAAFAATPAELNPAARLVQGGDVLSFLSVAANNSVSVIFYSLS